MLKNKNRHKQLRYVTRLEDTPVVSVSVSVQDVFTFSFPLDVIVPKIRPQLRRTDKLIFSKALTANLLLCIISTNATGTTAAPSPPH